MAFDPKQTLVLRMGERKNNRYMKTKEVDKDYKRCQVSMLI